MDFLVFPDHPATPHVAGQLTEGAMRAEYHESGRPWIVGNWLDRDIATVHAGPRRLALLGPAALKREVIAHRLCQARTIEDIDGITRDVPGCFHLVATFDGRVRVQGTLSDALRIYYAEVNGLTVAVDRPDRLVAATGALLDERVLAMHLLTPYSRPPWPISDHCLWAGVRKVAPGHYLELDQQGAGRIARWWQPPDPVVPLDQGAELLRTKLFEAVRTRADRSAPGGLSIDLSGGMDSTSLCFIADQLGLSFTSLHTRSADPSNIDTSWALHAQQNLTSATHTVVPAGALSGAFDEAAPLPSEVSFEGPTTLINRALIDTLAAAMARAGSVRHLRGDGSDELFQPNLTFTTALIRRRPLKGLSATLRLKAANRWSATATLHQLRRLPGYRRWLAGVSDRLTSLPSLQQTPGWEIPCQMPQWATPTAVKLVTELFDEALAGDVDPLIHDPVQNEILRQVQLLGTSGRQCSQIGEKHGVAFDLPYLDLQVVEAALSIRFEDRATPGFNKPVLAAAMKGVVPADILARRDKSHATRSMFDSLRRGRQQLVELSTDPELARRGLIDAECFRSIALGFHPDLTRVVQLGPTRATELWLRALPGRLESLANEP